MKNPKTRPLGDFEFRLIRAVLELDDQAFGPVLYEHLRKALKSPLNVGQIYMTANRLVKDNFLEVRPNQIQANGRPAGLFVCSPKGKRAYEEKIEFYKEQLGI